MDTGARSSRDHDANRPGARRPGSRPVGESAMHTIDPSTERARSHTLARVGPVGLNAALTIPDGPRGLVIIANGADDHVFVAGNSYVADALHGHGFATLEVNLLTRQEAMLDAETSQLRFDMDFLAARLAHVVAWIARQDRCADLAVGVFASGTCAAAAVQAAAQGPDRIDAVVCRAARPDLVQDAFGYLSAETLLVLGDLDVAHFEDHRAALVHAPAGSVDLVLIPDGRPLLDTAVERKAVADVAADWFARTLNGERWRGWMSDSARLTGTFGTA